MNKSKLNLKYLRLASLNAAVITIMCVAVLGLIRQSIPGLTPSIIIGYGCITMVCCAISYYLAFIYRWNEGPVFSLRRLYQPLTNYVLVLLPSMLYSAFAYGHHWLDYFYFDGHINEEKILSTMLAALVPVLFLFVIQLLAVNNDREIIINTAMLNLPAGLLAEKSGKDADAPSQADQDTTSAEAPSPTAARAGHIVTLQGNTKGGSLTIDIDKLFYAESNANYLRIVTYENGVKSQTIRLTIKQLEDELTSFPQMMRCHRAYMVNTNNISYYEGTSSKGEVHFALIKDTVPVSKTYATELSQRLGKV